MDVYNENKNNEQNNKRSYEDLITVWEEITYHNLDKPLQNVEGRKILKAKRKSKVK